MSERIIPHLKDAIRKVIAQGEQSQNPNDTICVYRGVGSKGQKLCCAVGHLIKDEYYLKALEGKLINTHPVAEALEKSLGFTLNGEERVALMQLQLAHDEWDKWKTEGFLETFIHEIKSRVDIGHLPKECLEALEG